MTALRYRARMTSPLRPRGGVARVCRYLYRVPLLLVHIIVFLPLILIGMLRPWGELRVGEATLGPKWSTGGRG